MKVTNFCYLIDSMETDDIIRQAQAKVSYQLVEELVTLTELSQAELLSLLGLSDHELVNLPNGECSILLSEHLLLLRSLFRHGLAVFAHSKAALTKWLKTSLPELAQAETGFFPVWPATPPPPLEQMTAFEPFDLVTYARQREEQARLKPADEQANTGPYPSPFSLLNTVTGIGLADAVLSRLEAGIYL